MTDSEEPQVGLFADESIPEPIIELAAACLEYIRRTTGVAIDCDAESISVADHYVKEAASQAEKRPEVQKLLARAIGAYFGEVVRQKFGGFWQLPGENERDWRVCLTPVFMSFNPIGAAYDALNMGTQHEGPSSVLKLAPDEREAVRQRLAALPEVPEDEFYLLSSRLDAIEVAVDALHSLQSEQGYEEIEYTEEDYAGELRPLMLN